jgi:cleavage and polyadenylation specificity factor subunit 3
MEVEVISFSAHADYEQTSGFLDAVQPPHVVLVHGELEGMKRLRAALANTAAQQRIERHMHMPGNGHTLHVSGQPLLASEAALLGQSWMAPELAP